MASWVMLPFPEVWMCHWGAAMSRGPVCSIFVFLLKNGFKVMVSSSSILHHFIYSLPILCTLISLSFIYNCLANSNPLPTQSHSSLLLDVGSLGRHPALNILPSHCVGGITNAWFPTWAWPLWMRIWLTLLFVTADTANFNPPLASISVAHLTSKLREK